MFFMNFGFIPLAQSFSLNVVLGFTPVSPIQSPFSVPLRSLRSEVDVASARFSHGYQKFELESSFLHSKCSSPLSHTLALEVTDLFN